jgi:site-specific DNA recombinase
MKSLSLHHEQKTAAIYARVSSDEQAKGYSLPTQIEACEQYAVQKGYRLLETYKDDYTGASLDRPGLDELRKLLTAKKVDIVIVYDVDRLARKSVYQMLLEEEFAKQGALVEYVNGQYENSDEGRLQKQIKGAIAEYEKAKILERSKRGKRGKAKNGYVNVGARSPYGYKVKSEAHKQWLLVDEEEEAIVRLIFKLYTEGDQGIPRATRGKKDDERWSLREIALYLTRLGVPTRGDKVRHVAKKSAKCVWTSGMIRHVLTNETYLGMWHYGKTQVISDGKESTRKAKSKTGLGKQVPRPREEWIAVPVPSIVDAEIFRKAQDRLESNKKAIIGRPVKYDYLLNKRLRCIKCGYAMRPQTRREGQRYYHCNGSRQPTPACDVRRSFHVDVIDETVWLWVKGMLQDPQRVMAGLETDRQEEERQHSHLLERMTLIRKRTAEDESKLSRLLDLFLEGEFDREVLLKRKIELEKQLADLKYEQMSLQEHLDSVIMSDDVIASIEAICAEISVGLDNATFEDKKRYFEILDVRAKAAFEDGKEVVYAKCKIGQQQVLQMQTSHLSNIGAMPMTPCVFLSTALSV